MEARRRLCLRQKEKGARTRVPELLARTKRVFGRSQASGTGPGSPIPFLPLFLQVAFSRAFSPLWLFQGCASLAPLARSSGLSLPSFRGGLLSQGSFRVVPP